MRRWDGRGLPPGAEARLDRFSPAGARTSLLTVPGAVGAEVAGFTPLGEVMGRVVHRVPARIAIGVSGRAFTDPWARSWVVRGGKTRKSPWSPSSPPRSGRLRGRSSPAPSAIARFRVDPAAPAGALEILPLNRS